MRRPVVEEGRPARLGTSVSASAGALLTLLLAISLTGCSTADNGATAEAAAAREVVDRAVPLVLTGYALEGSATPSSITRDGRLFATIGVDGVTLTGRGGVSAVSRDASALRHAAVRAHRKPVLLLSNYSNRINDFDEPLAHQMLANPRYRAAAVAALVRRAAGFSGVQIDLESLLPRDRAGLVAFTRALQRAMPARKTVSMAFMASSNARGYAARGYDLGALARALDVAVLMSYDQHGPWSGPGPIGAMSWVKSELRYFLTRVPRRKVDLGAAAYGYQWGGGAEELTVPQARRMAGARATWSPSYGEWHATLANGRRLWWDDARSVGLRRNLASSQGLHGLAVWEIGGSGRLS